jgi:type IV pilus assembly protein PilC
MLRFTYVARDQDNRKVEGSFEAESSYALISLLRERGLTVISVGKPRAMSAVSKKKRTRRGGKKIKTAELAHFTRQLASLVDAGVPLTRSLGITAEQTENATLQQIVLAVKNDVEAGQDFSVALSRHPKTFSVLFFSMVEAGLQGGGLATILSQLASYLEARAELTRKVKSAMTYPVFISIFFFLVLVVVMFFLIPKFEDIFSGFGIELPLLTRTMIGMSRFLIDHIIYEIVGTALMGFLFYRWSHTVNGRYTIDGKKLGVPVFGKLLRKETVARFSQTLATLVGNGVSVIDALQIVARTSGNVVVEEAIEGVRTGVINGASISGEMSKRAIFPQMLVGMVSAGEESGTLPQMLGKVSDFYSGEVDAMVDGLSSIIEPLLIVSLGGVVAIVVLAIYLPIFQMVTGIH